jgi:hypothetical protein
MNFGVSDDLEFTEMLFGLGEAIEGLSMAVACGACAVYNDAVLRVLHGNLDTMRWESITVVRMRRCVTAARKEYIRTTPTPYIVTYIF